MVHLKLLELINHDSRRGPKVMIQVIGCQKVFSSIFTDFSTKKATSNGGLYLYPGDPSDPGVLGI